MPVDPADPKTWPYPERLIYDHISDMVYEMGVAETLKLPGVYSAILHNLLHQAIIELDEIKKEVNASNGSD